MSNTTLPHLEPIDGERILNSEEKRKRKDAIKLKREAREKKKEQQRKKEEEAKAPNTSFS
jgi:hypothetical protein